jgi:hypothetical protein
VKLLPGTTFQAIFVACGSNENAAGMFYGNVWKKVIIERPGRWIGMRSDPATRENRKGDKSLLVIDAKEAITVNRELLLTQDG